MLYACAKLSQGSRDFYFKFVNKIFVIGKPLTKITKIFLLENVQLYGIYSVLYRFSIVCFGSVLYYNMEFSIKKSGSVYNLISVSMCKQAV